MTPSDASCTAALPAGCVFNQAPISLTSALHTVSLLGCRAQHRPAPRSGSVEERSGDRVLGPYPAAIRSLPAAEARCSPRHGSEPLLADLLFAVEADPKRTAMDSTECGSHFVQPD